MLIDPSIPNPIPKNGGGCVVVPVYDVELAFDIATCITCQNVCVCFPLAQKVISVFVRLNCF